MSIRLIFLFLLLSFQLFSQKTTIYTHPEHSYELGMDLYSKKKYVTAQFEFQRIIDSKENISLEVRGNAAYYFAVCAAELFHKDAEFLLLNFMESYPENQNYHTAGYHLGNYYYKQKKYKKSVEWLTKLDQNELTQEKRDEVNFKLGYAHYMTNDFESAGKAFFLVKDGESKYASAAGYYYAHMSFVNGNYETALKSFLKLKDSEAFAPVVPYYITQIYYKQGKDDELLKFAPSILDSLYAKNGLEIGRMVAESHYRKGEYKAALPYLLDYEKNSSAAGRTDDYQIAYCYHKLGDFEKAIPYFQKVTSGDDLLAQNSYFLLADSYVRSNAKRSARTAFQSASNMDYDRDIQEEAQFNFAKLSNELSYQSVALEAFRKFLQNFPNSVHVDEANEMLVGIYTNTHNYKDALTAIESIKVKTPPIKAAYQKVAYYRGVELFMDNKNSEAIEMFNSSLSQPVDATLAAEANYWKAEAYYRTGDFTKSLKSYNDFLFTPAAVTGKRYNLAHYNVGYCHFKNEDFGAAQVSFRKYIQSKNQTDTDRYNDAILRVADCFFMMKDQANAMDYYNQAINANSRSSDYAIYQKAVIYGIQGKMSEKVNTLQKLFDKYPKSVYYDDGLYEAGQASLMLGNHDEAHTYYSQVIRDFPSGSYVKKAELGKALVLYNSKQDDKALAAYQQIVSKYPNTKESREALAQIKNISVTQNKVDEYLRYIKNVPNADVSKAAEDSLTYEAAELLYTQGNCVAAVKDFESYLSRFPHAIFLVNASYYKADCLFRSKDFTAALIAYQTVINEPRNSFTEKSLLNAGLINYRQKNYQESLKNYTALETVAEVKDNILAAQAGQMRSNFKLQNYEATLISAQRILDGASTDKDLINEAHLLAGKCHYFNNDLGNARTEFGIVSKRTNSEMTAESKYYLAEIEFKSNNYKECQKLIFEIQKQVPSYDFWIAKGFILLGDTYMAQNDSFQAKETYKSIVENYEKGLNDPEDIVMIAKQKFDTISMNDLEKNKKETDSKDDEPSDESGEE
jgi:TolA-binding protein